MIYTKEEINELYETGKLVDEEFYQYYSGLPNNHTYWAHGKTLKTEIPIKKKEMDNIFLWGNKIKL